MQQLRAAEMTTMTTMTEIAANQGIGQDQDSEQNSQCVSGEDATVSCNNVSFQNQVNSGNNALAQD